MSQGSAFGCTLGFNVRRPWRQTRGDLSVRLYRCIFVLRCSGHMSRPFLPPTRDGIIVDAIAIVANLILFPFVLTRVGSLFDASFANNDSAFLTLAGLMMFTLAARLFGLYLKRAPLKTRLEESAKTSFPMYFFLLNIG